MSKVKSLEAKYEATCKLEFPGGVGGGGGGGAKQKPSMKGNMDTHFLELHNINMFILFTVLHIFLILQVGRFYLKINAFYIVSLVIISLIPLT